MRKLKPRYLPCLVVLVAATVLATMRFLDFEAGWQERRDAWPEVLLALGLGMYWLTWVLDPTRKARKSQGTT